MASFPLSPDAAGELEFSGAAPLFAREEVRAAENDLAAAIGTVIRRGQKAGTIRNDLPARFLAQTLHSILKDSVHDDAHEAGTLDVAALKANVARLLLESR